MTRVLGSLLEFPGILVSFLLVFGILKRRYRFLLLALFVYLLLTDLPWIPLENLWTVEGNPTDGVIVILGGGLVETPEGWKPSPSTIQRLERGFSLWLERRGKILVSGGAVGDTTEASVMKSVLMSWGVPEGSIVVEGRSRNTFENALFSFELLGATRVNLVTSALHTRRAKMVFEKVGFSVEVLPCDYPVDSSLRGESFLPSSKSLEFLQEFSHEILGLIYYLLTGRVRCGSGG